MSEQPAPVPPKVYLMRIVDFDMPFFAMVGLIIKIYMAAAFAAFILGCIVFLIIFFTGAFGRFL